MIVFKLEKPSGKATQPPLADAELFDISSHLELEVLALAWAIRNRQHQANRQADKVGKTECQTKPFGLPDPTRGATHFHRHEQTPPWAATREPIALIGNYLFYDLRKEWISPDDEMQA